MGPSSSYSYKWIRIIIFFFFFLHNLIYIYIYIYLSLGIGVLEWKRKRSLLIVKVCDCKRDVRVPIWENSHGRERERAAGLGREKWPSIYGFEAKDSSDLCVGFILSLLFWFLWGFVYVSYSYAGFKEKRQ